MPPATCLELRSNSAMHLDCFESLHVCVCVSFGGVAMGARLCKLARLPIEGLHCSRHVPRFVRSDNSRIRDIQERTNQINLFKLICACFKQAKPVSLNSYMCFR